VIFDFTATPKAPRLSPPPPPPPGRPPLSPPQSHSRKQSAESLYSEITLDASPKSFSWNEKQVADEIEQVSKETKEDDARKSSLLAKPGTILTLSQVSRACPVEEEAEKLILKALDDKKDRPKMGSSILPQVPDNSASAFEATTPVEAGTSHAQQGPASPSLSNRGAWATPLKADGANDAQQGAANTSPSLHEAVPSVHASAPSFHDTNSASSTSTIRKRGNILGLLRRKRHTEATQLQVTTPLVSTKPPASQNVEGGDISNEDALINNANLLFRRSTRSDDNSSMSNHSDIEQGSSRTTDPSGKRRWQQMRARADRDVQNEVSAFQSFVQPRKKGMRALIKNGMLYLILPLAIVSTILFYGTGNPELGNTGASISWFLLFIIRNLITYALAHATSVYVIQYLSLYRNFTVKMLGPVITLTIVQSDGYPSRIFFWGLWSLILLCGKGEFSNHWLFWQNAIDMCNSNNPAGTITESGLYVSAVGCAVLFGAAVAMKRLWLGLFMAKKSYRKWPGHSNAPFIKLFSCRLCYTVDYKAKFERTNNDMELVREIAALYSQQTVAPEAQESVVVDGLDNSSDASQSDTASDTTSATNNSGYNDHVLNSSQREIILQHLEEWEEPVAPKTTVCFVCRTRMV
jgi:hypothetical protein